MATAGLIALLDDISTIADDVATLTYLATKKTTGVVTDDMAVTAEQAVGLRRERELPVIFAVARGSLFNKAVILAPGALALNAVAPWAIVPILMAGGAFLCFEGVEKLLHKFMPHGDHEGGSHGPDLASVDPEAFEKMRVQGAIRTDLILSAEVIAISLGEIASAPFTYQVAALYLISVVMTVGVYGMVAGLVKLDDLGEALVAAGGPRAGLGRALIAGTPWLLKAISWIGMVAMLLVGGHILLHGFPAAEHAVHDLIHRAPEVAQGALTLLAELVTGLIAGSAVVAVVATGLPARLWAMRPGASR